MVVFVGGWVALNCVFGGCVLDCFSVLPWLGYLICCLDDFVGFDLPAGLGEFLVCLFYIGWVFVTCVLYAV